MKDSYSGVCPGNIFIFYLNNDKACCVAQTSQDICSSFLMAKVLIFDSSVRNL